MERTMNQLLEEISRLPETVPGVSENYVSELQRYLQVLEKSYPTPEAQKEYRGWYGNRVSGALRRAMSEGEISPFTIIRIKRVMHLIDERYGIMTNFPIVEQPINNCIVRDGKVYRPEIVLPNNQRIALYEE